MLPEDCFNVFYQQMHKDAQSHTELKRVTSHQSAFIFLGILLQVVDKIAYNKSKKKMFIGHQSKCRWCDYFTVITLCNQHFFIILY